MLLFYSILLHACASASGLASESIILNIIRIIYAEWFLEDIVLYE